MGYQRVLESSHVAKVNFAIDSGLSPSLIREGLVREGIDQFTLNDIEEYVQYYYQIVINKSIVEQKELYTNISSSVPVLLANNVSPTSLNYSQLIELDILRAEKLIQDILQGKNLSETVIKNFKVLSQIKRSAVDSLTTFLEYKKAISDARTVQVSSTKVNMEQLGPYLQQLSDMDRTIALDVLNIVMDSRADELPPLPKR